MDTPPPPTPNSAKATVNKKDQAASPGANRKKGTPDPEWLKDQTESLSSFIRSARNLTISFLSVLLYIGVSAWSTTDLDLLKDNPIRLPLVGLEIPIKGFYLIVPWLVVAVFFNLMFHLNTISARCRWLLDLKQQDKVAYGEVTDRLPIYPFITLCFTRSRPRVLSILFAGLFLFTEVMAPLFIVTLLLVKFFAYQDSSASLWQWGAVCLCAATAMFFWWRTLSLIGTALAIRMGWAVIGLGSVTLVTTLFLVWISPAVLHDRVGGTLTELACKYNYWHGASEKSVSKNQGGEGQPEKAGPEERCAPAGWLPDGLSGLMRIDIGSGEIVVKNQPQAKHINRLTNTRSEDEDHLLTESLSHMRGVELRDRLLIGTRLSGAYLPNIDLNKVAFVNADLQGTNLRGAVLTQVTFQDVQMSRSKFTSAKIDDTTLINTPLFEVNFTDVKITNLELKGPPAVIGVIGKVRPCGEIISEEYKDIIPCLMENEPKPTIATLSGQLADAAQKHETAKQDLDNERAQHGLTQQALDDEKRMHETTKQTLAELEEKRIQLEQDLQFSEALVASLQDGANDDELARTQLEQAVEERDNLRQKNTELQAELRDKTQQLEDIQLALSQANEIKANPVQPTISDKIITECEGCPTMVRIDSGSFMMGSL